MDGEEIEDQGQDEGDVVGLEAPMSVVDVSSKGGRIKIVLSLELTPENWQAIGILVGHSAQVKMTKIDPIIEEVEPDEDDQPADGELPFDEPDIGMEGDA